MKKAIKLLVILLSMLLLCAFGRILNDRSQLQNAILRLHIVANSNSAEDQAVKLRVRDAVLAYLNPEINNISDKESAMRYIRTHVAQLERIANNVLTHSGITDTATVSLSKEHFDRREYESFSLPAGVYDSLMITIGSGSGKNWWCVVFPAFCIEASSGSVHDAAVAAGVSESLVDTIQRSSRYEVRFFLLDCLGRLENFLLKA